MSEAKLIQVVIGIAFFIFGFGSFKNYFEGWGQRPSTFAFQLIPPNKATKLQQYFLLFQSVVLIAAGILCVFVEL